ncbi:MAG: hypothetical protein J07HN6_00881 [Halonotius sp. J07HN6]|nr:MAG: hypothetical protein J07HN6_00881 [Halonotius sp. J07HN6]
MPPDEFSERPTAADGLPETVSCSDCETAFESPGEYSFLILNHLTAPVIGCDDHLSEFAAICGYTTVATASAVGYRPAGGIGCPSCRLSVHNPRQPVIPVKDGAVGIVACPEHQTKIIDRFQQGLETKHELTAGYRYVGLTGSAVASHRVASTLRYRTIAPAL